MRVFSKCRKVCSTPTGLHTLGRCQFRTFHNHDGPPASSLPLVTMLEFLVTDTPIRMLAIDIDGTLLNPQFEISGPDLAALQRANALGIEVVVVTGRRHDFALPIVQLLGFDLWVISSNGAVTRSLSGETFYRDLLPADTCRQLCEAMVKFRGNTV